MHKSLTSGLLALGISVGSIFAGPSSAKGISPSTPMTTSIVEVRVKSGDTLWKLARRYGTTVRALASLNGIRNPDHLNSGRILKVPCRSKEQGRSRIEPNTVVSRSRDSRASTKWLEENGSWEELAAPVLSGRLSSYYGYRHGRMHWGIDLACPSGTAIYAVAAGEVSFVGWKSGYGLTVEIDHGGFRSRYAHNSRVIVTVGQRVIAGEHIAAVGHTGRATGNHLHLELERSGYRINPLPFFDCY